METVGGQGARDAAAGYAPVAFMQRLRRTASADGTSLAARRVEKLPQLPRSADRAKVPLPRAQLAPQTAPEGVSAGFLHTFLAEHGASEQALLERQTTRAMASGLKRRMQAA